MLVLDVAGAKDARSAGEWEVLLLDSKWHPVQRLPKEIRPVLHVDAAPLCSIRLQSFTIRKWQHMHQYQICEMPTSSRPAGMRCSLAAPIVVCHHWRYWSRNP
eukprot:1780320-Prymnesium_polylepis.2